MNNFGDETMSKHSVGLYEQTEIKNKNHYSLEFPNGDKIVCYFPFSSIQIIFYDINSSDIPDLYNLGYRKLTDKRYLRAFICRNGSCEFAMDGKTDELSAGYSMFDFSVGDNGKFSFTCHEFKGVEINIQVDSFDEESPGVYRKFKPIIKAMKLPEKEMFLSDDYIFRYSSDTEKHLDSFLKAGFEGLENIVTVAYLVVLGRSLGVDIKNLQSNLTDSQLIIAKDIYDSLTNEYSERWRAQQFADKYSLGVSTVKRYFKKAYGFGFKEYQTKIIMEHASDLLTTTNLRISEISDMVGYSDYRFFTSAFKKYYKCTPSEYRNSYKVRSQMFNKR